MHFAPNKYKQLFKFYSILFLRFLNVNLKFWNFDFVYNNKDEIYFNFSFFMSSLFSDIFFAPNTSAIYILYPTIKELRVGRVAGSHVSFFMSNMFRDIHFAPNTSVIYILHPTIPLYTYTFLNVIKVKFILIFHVLFSPNTSTIYIFHPTSINNYLNFIQYYF
jgi:hypothetical protein